LIVKAIALNVWLKKKIIKLIYFQSSLFYSNLKGGGKKLFLIRTL